MAFGITKDNAEKPTFAYVLVTVGLNGLLAAFWTYCAARDSRHSVGDTIVAICFWLLTAIYVYRVFRANKLAGES